MPGQLGAGTCRGGVAVRGCRGAPCQVGSPRFGINLAVALADGLRILQIPGSADGEGGVDGDADVKIAEGAVKLPTHVRTGGPALLVVSGNAGVPLGHAVGDAFLVVSAAATDLQGDLRLEGHVHDGTVAGGQGLIQMHHQHSFVHLETYIAAILLQGMDALIADFVFFEVEDTGRAPVRRDR